MEPETTQKTGRHRKATRVGNYNTVKMKNILRIFVATIIASLIFTNCNNSSKPQSNNTTTDTSIVKSKLAEAKLASKTLLEYVEQADTKQITKEQLDLKAKPLKSHLDSLRLVLTVDEIKELDTYSTQLFNEMIDRKVVRDRK